MRRTILKVELHLDLRYRKRIGLSRFQVLIRRPATFGLVPYNRIVIRIKGKLAKKRAG